MARLRIVPDTNVLVSGIGYPASIPGVILKSWRKGSCELVISQYILDETARVLPRLVRLNFTSEKIRDLLQSFHTFAHLVEPDAATDPSLRDPNDQKVLATFRAAKADYLITGDKDLLALADRYPILTPAEFWQRHG